MQICILLLTSVNIVFCMYKPTLTINCLGKPHDPKQRIWHRRHQAFIYRANPKNKAMKKDKMKIYNKKYRETHREQLALTDKIRKKAWRDTHKKEIHEAYLIEKQKKIDQGFDFKKQHSEINLRRKREILGYYSLHCARKLVVDGVMIEDIRVLNRLKNITSIQRTRSSHTECRCCGETEIAFLTLDHIYNNGSHHKRIWKKRHNVKSLNLYEWCRLTKKKTGSYPPIFQVLCMNCNHAKWHSLDQKCPHQHNIRD